MGLPGSIHARLFYRCAIRRYSEAQVLLEAGYTTGAVYLAGYAIEYMFKAMILEVTPNPDQMEILKGFRGKSGHDYESLSTAPHK